MSQFLTDLNCKLLDDDKTWILQEPLVYESDLLGTITIPAGFVTDFASVPRVPLIYSFYGDRAHRESVVHDLLYRVDAAQCISFWENLERHVSFDQANKVFLEAMAARKKSRFVRYGMYWGVCLGGRSSYHKRLVSWKGEKG